MSETGKRTMVGYHYDIARGAYLKPPVFQEALRVAAAAGFTHFLPYLEAMIRLPSCAKASPECAYTPAQWKEFEAVAQEAGIELVPHFNVIGHTEQFARAYPELMGNPHEPELDVSSETARAWVQQCLREFCDASTAPHFLIGGDEWQTPNSLLAKPGFSVAQAWRKQINDAAQCLMERHRTPLVWHDMVIHYPEILQKLSRDIVFLFWFYDEDSSYPAIEFLRKRGFRTVMAGGILEGIVSRRTAAGFETALESARQWNADGIVMTSWGDGRWEFQRMNIILTGRRLRGEPWPPGILEAGALRSALLRLPVGAPQAAAWRKRLRTLLESPEWSEFPEAREVLVAEQDRDIDTPLRRYRLSHSPGGLEAAIQRPPSPSRPPAIGAKPPPHAADFGIRVEDSGVSGPSLRLSNGAETMVVYPKVGGVLQDWNVNGIAIIPHTLPRYLASARGKALPGGYRSHNGAAGFRPIWALGTHSNPCILWQYPQEWRIAGQTPDRVTVELCLELPHILYHHRLSIVRGQSGFQSEVSAVNRLPAPAVHAGFSFNLALALDADGVDACRFAWEADGKRRVSLAQAASSLVHLDAHEHLSVESRDWTVTIRSNPAETAGYWTDWAPGTYVTPDLHGVYRPREPGETTVVRWDFDAAPAAAGNGAAS